jgi:Tfp pilus assembly protein PilW
VKFIFINRPVVANSGPRRILGHTLVEMMVAMSVFSLAMIGMVYSHMYGLKMNELVQSKLGASDMSRRGFNVLVKDIRSAKVWAIGNGNATQFTAIANGLQQQGTAIRLQNTTDTNSYTIYYFDTSNAQLLRRGSGTTGSTLIASYLTNAMYFRAELPTGQTMTNLSYKGVINCNMEFAQFQYPLTKVGTGNLYDYYRLSFKATPHVPDGP